MTETTNTAAMLDTPYDLTTKQGIFDHVATALMKQGHKSVTDSNKSCHYRSPTGSKCAVGHLIPDAGYSATFEGCSFPTPETFGMARPYMARKMTEVRNALDPRIPRTDEMMRFLRDLQCCHDTPPTTPWRADWEDAMRSLARHEGLSTDIFDTMAAESAQ